MIMFSGTICSRDNSKYDDAVSVSKTLLLLIRETQVEEKRDYLKIRSINDNYTDLHFTL